ATEHLKMLPVDALDLDSANPRLPEDVDLTEQRKLIEYVASEYGALEVAESIANHGYFGSEPLIAIQDGDRYTVVEGNRRLAALKLLKSRELRESIELDDDETWGELSTSPNVPN